MLNPSTTSPTKIPPIHASGFASRDDSVKNLRLAEAALEAVGEAAGGALAVAVAITDENARYRHVPSLFAFRIILSYDIIVVEAVFLCKTGEVLIAHPLRHRLSHALQLVHVRD